MNILIGILTAIHVVIAVFLVMLVLMQKSHDQGVGAAFGGGMTDTVFGGGTTTALVRLTIYCACALLATTILLAILHSRHGTANNSSLLRKATQSAPSIPMTSQGNAPLPMPSAARETQPLQPATSSGTPQQSPSPAGAAAPAASSGSAPLGAPQPEPAK
jgi:preprotein translocase subunit SecG